MPYRLPDESGLTGISVFPSEQRYAKSAEQQLVVTARFDDGKTEDVTHLADFSSIEKEIAGVDRNGLLRVGTLSGEGVVVVRYLGEVATAVTEINGGDRQDLYEQLLKVAKRKTAEADTNLDNRGRAVAESDEDYGRNVLVAEQRPEDLLAGLPKTDDEQKQLF